MFLTVTGPVGVGKTTLAQKLQLAHPECVLLSEDVSANPFARAYAHTVPVAVRSFEIAAMQMSYMHQRLASYLQRDPLRSTITDRSLSEDFWIYLLDQILAGDVWLRHGLPNLLTYLQAIALTAWPSHIVVLNAKPETLSQRIQTRSRPFEDYINPALVARWQKRHAFWQRWILPHLGAQVLIIDTDLADPDIVFEQVEVWLQEHP